MTSSSVDSICVSPIHPFSSGHRPSIEAKEKSTRCPLGCWQFLSRGEMEPSATFPANSLFLITFCFDPQFLLRLFFFSPFQTSAFLASQVADDDEERVLVTVEHSQGEFSSVLVVTQKQQELLFSVCSHPQYFYRSHFNGSEHTNRPSGGY